MHIDQSAAATPQATLAESTAPGSSPLPPPEAGAPQNFNRSAVAIPESIKLVIEKAGEFISRMDLSATQASHLQGTLQATLGVASKQDPAESALFSALIRCSPEVKRLSDWASTLRTQTGVVPLHAATFALLGAVYFYARLVKYDAALASRTLDGAPESGAPSPETAAGYRLLLKTLAKEKDSLVGSLVTRERDDSNSATQMHFLAGVLAPLFAEISKAERAQKPTLIGSIFARFNREETPEHLKDLGLLETIRPAHTAVIDELGAIRRGAEYSEKAEAASQRERDAEQVKQEADQKRKAEEQAELAKTREERHKKLLKSLTRTLRAAKTSTRRGDDQSEPILDEKTVVCTIYEAIKAAQDVNDRILYAILSECPKGSKAWLAKAGLPLNEAINNHNRTRGGTVWDDKNIGNVALALLWETLSKLSVIHETSRFEETQTQLALYIDGNSYGEVTDYRAEYMNEVRQAFIRLHEKKCQELLP